MNHIEEIFLRADIRQIREFLLHGVEEVNTDPHSSADRLKEAQSRMLAQLQKNCPDGKDCEEITRPVFFYASVVQEVYMEIGLQVGAILAAQAYQNLATALKDS